MGENEGGNDMGRFRETRIETQAFLAISNLHQKPEVLGFPT